MLAVSQPISWVGAHPQAAASWVCAHYRSTAQTIMWCMCTHNVCATQTQSHKHSHTCTGFCATPDGVVYSCCLAIAPACCITLSMHCMWPVHRLAQGQRRAPSVVKGSPSPPSPQVSVAGLQTQGRVSAAAKPNTTHTPSLQHIRLDTALRTWHVQRTNAYKKEILKSHHTIAATQSVAVKQ